MDGYEQVTVLVIRRDHSTSEVHLQADDNGQLTVLGAAS